MNRDQFESLGDKHKKFEKQNQTQFMPLLPIVVRVDGRAFHTFTKGLQKPFDGRLTFCMHEAAKALLVASGAKIAYHQSDEITLILPPTEIMIFGGRKSKIETILASTASVAFYKAVAQYLPEKADSLPVFDARAWQYPTLDLCIENLMWREADATRNSLMMACVANYPQKKLEGANSRQQHDLLHQKGINWNDYSSDFKRGTYFAKRQVECIIDDTVWNKIPEKNRPESRSVLRSVVMRLDMPPAEKVTNMIDVVFGDAAPTTAAD